MSILIAVIKYGFILGAFLILIVVTWFLVVGIKIQRENKRGDYSSLYKSQEALTKYKQDKIMREDRKKSANNVSLQNNIKTNQDNSNSVKCPKCGSTQITANKKGFSLGKAAVGSAVVLPLGAVTGMIGKNKIYITCLKCGHSWKPGK